MHQNDPELPIRGHYISGGRPPGAFTFWYILFSQVYPASYIAKRDGSAAPERRPGGGSGTCSFDSPGKISASRQSRPIPFGDAAAAGRSPGGVCSCFFKKNFTKNADCWKHDELRRRGREWISRKNIHPGSPGSISPGTASNSESDTFCFIPLFLCRVHRWRSGCIPRWSPA
jgi:hypothetical protein